MKKQHDPRKAGRDDIEQVSTINSITHLNTINTPVNHEFEHRRFGDLLHVTAYLARLSVQGDAQ